MEQDQLLSNLNALTLAGRQAHIKKTKDKKIVKQIVNKINNK
jgi:hypothetical protein